MTTPSDHAQVELSPRQIAARRQSNALAVIMSKDGSDLAERAAAYSALPAHLQFAVTLRETATLAAYIADSEFVPEAMRGKPDAVTACFLAGAELGMSHMQSLRNLHIVKGKVGQYAEYMRARILAAGHDIEVVEASDTRVKMRGRRREWPSDKPDATVTFTADQARRAKIDLGGYPEDKLVARATVRLARRTFADVIGGFAGVEELQDVTDDAAALGAVVSDGGSVTTAPTPKRARRPAERAPTPAPPPLPEPPPGPIRVSYSADVVAVADDTGNSDDDAEAGPATQQQRDDIVVALDGLRVAQANRARLVSLAVNRDVGGKIGDSVDLDAEEAAHVVAVLGEETAESVAQWLDHERDTVLPKPAGDTA